MQEQEEEVEIHGDVLETILSHVPLVDLVSASAVSKWWRAAVSSSLRHNNPPKPWLILHTQSTRFPYAAAAAATHAYDPRSNVWIKICRPSIIPIATAPLRSSHSDLLYMLSPSKFSFSLDPLASNWCTVDPPAVWRRDPIVGRVGGDCIVIAGGPCDFEDDPLAVEIYDIGTRAWSTCEPMPASLRGSAASQWISVATTAGKLVIADKKSGLTHWFDPVTRSWSKPFVLNPGEPVTSYHIGYSDNVLILIGFCRIENVERVKIWKVFGDDFSCEEIGEMPEELAAKLRSKSFENSSMEVRVAGNVVYLYNTWEVVACEMRGGGGGCWLWSVRNVVAREGMVAERVVFSCSEIGIEELQRAMAKKNWRFEVSPVS